MRAIACGRPTRAAAALLILTLILAPTGCGGSGDKAPECKQDTECAGDRACLGGGCVPRLGSETVVWSVEVSPGAQQRLALREYPQFTFTGMPAQLALDRKVTMALLLEARQPDPPLEMRTSVHVVLSAPSTIPGRGELQFEGDGSHRTPFLPYEVSVTFPERFLGAKGQLNVVPVAPLDRYVPPWLLPVILEPGLAVVLPGPSDTLVIDGRLESADPMAKLEMPYQARARVGDRVVSSVAVTGDDGGFVLRVQKNVVGRGGQALSVELGPVDATQPFPTLLISPVDAGKPSLGTLRLPAYQKPEQFEIPVVAGQTRVAGATVRFTAELPGATPGVSAVYTRVAQTNPEGKAMVWLIPGATAKTRDYTVKVTTPKGSAFAARCLGTYAVAGGATGGSRVGAAIELVPKLALSGRVVRSSGLPAVSVRVKATSEGDAFKEECGGELVSPPAETTTDGEGRYRLLLDPGEYHLDVEPPPGSPMPMGAETVAVQESLVRDVVLRAPVLVEGVVTSPDSMSVGDAEVRAFEMNGGGKAQVRGVTLSGPDGRFRLVLPR